MAKIKDLSIDELKELIRETVEQTVVELFGDPDAGLELQEEVKERLQRSFAAEDRGEPTIPAEKVAQDLGLER
jgi:hypothetical protein